MAYIKDYSTKKDPEETISEINKLLRSFGVKAVMSEYGEDGNVKHMSFQLEVNGQNMGFRLPTNWEPVLEVFCEGAAPRPFCTEEQARRTAWRLVYHWIDAQLALVRINMVKIQTVFLPYAVGKNGKTLGSCFEESPQLLLGD